MAQSRGQKRAAKAKKRKQSRAKKTAAPTARVAPAAEAAPPDGAPIPAEAFAEVGYDPNADLDIEGWKALSERDRLSRVAKYHNTFLKKAQMPPSMQRHAAMHVIVESQLADQAPPEARGALRRLQEEGMSRHDAVHAIGWLATEHMKRAMAKQRPVDDKAYARDLATLTVRSWLRMASGRRG